MQICIEPSCGNQFEVTPGEKKFYESKGLKLPRRCESCRNRRRSSGLTQPVISKEQAEEMI